MAHQFSRKDLKRQDEFLSRSTKLAHWAMQRRKTIALAILVVVAIVSVLVGVRSYRQRQEQNAAALLAVALSVYNSPVTPDDDAGTAPADEHSPAGHRHFPSDTERYEAAVEALRPVVEQYAGYPSGRAAAFYLGSSLAAVDRMEEAEEALLQASESGAPLIRGMALQRLGDLYVQMERYDDAVAIFDRIIGRPPGAFPVEEALAAKARAHEAAGDVQAAMVAYQRLAEEYEGSVYALPARTRAEEIAAQLGVDLDAES